MEKTLAEHIRGLEQKLNALSSQMMEESDSHSRNQLESELRAVDTALAHYRRAFDIESRLSMLSHASGTKYSTEETT
jgi:predicted  nucleic acid-binding Zn-ribbon protein